MYLPNLGITCNYSTFKKNICILHSHEHVFKVFFGHFWSIGIKNVCINGKDRLTSQETMDAYFMLITPWTGRDYLECVLQKGFGKWLSLCGSRDSLLTHCPTCRGMDRLVDFHVAMRLYGLHQSRLAFPAIFSMHSWLNENLLIWRWDLAVWCCCFVWCVWPIGLTVSYFEMLLSRFCQQINLDRKPWQDFQII